MLFIVDESSTEFPAYPQMSTHRQAGAQERSAFHRKCECEEGRLVKKQMRALNSLGSYSRFSSASEPSLVFFSSLSKQLNLAPPITLSRTCIYKSPSCLGVKMYFHIKVLKRIVRALASPPWCSSAHSRNQLKLDSSTTP
jgi:hypothetical protein